MEDGAWSVPTPEHRLALGGTDVLRPAPTVTGLGDTVLGDTSQTQEDASCVTPLTGGPRRSQTHRDGE